MTASEPADPCRRRFLLAAGSAAATVAASGIMAACSSRDRSDGSKNRRPGSTATTVHYGDAASQFGRLHLPSGSGPVPVVVLVHGGFWLAQYGLELMDDLVADVVARGWGAWNVEYGRVGTDGGGWPGTFEDVAAAVDHLAALHGGAEQSAAGSRLDLARIGIVGHSAGGQLATWAAGRTGLPATAPGANPKIHVVAAVSQAGVLDLARAAREGVGGSAVADFMGGGPNEHPDRYAVGSPIERLPVGVPVRCVHGRQDSNVPLDQSQRYVAAATKAGDPAELAAFDGDHFDVINPAHQSWIASASWLAAHFAI